MTNDIVISTAAAIMPVMSIETAIGRRQMFVELVQGIMSEGTDYGVIPGTTKKTLLKPGAEKLVSFFGLSPSFEDVQVTEDWTGAAHNGEPFFYYRQRCHLSRDDRRIASADGSCNSWETKYRYRKADRVCPNCDKPAIMRSKFPPKDNPSATPGWYCNAKAGGCGASFPATDPAIVNQQTGRVPNPDPAEIVNTLLKMAQKRAMIAATLIAVNASEFFTQDMEDLPAAEYRAVDSDTGEVTGTRPLQSTHAQTGKTLEVRNSSAAEVDPLIAKWQKGQADFAHAPKPANGQWGALQAIVSGIVGGEDERHRFYSLLFGREIGSANDLSAPEAAWLHATVKPRKTGDSWRADELMEQSIASFMQRHPAPAADFPAAEDLHPQSAHQEQPA